MLKSAAVLGVAGLLLLAGCSSSGHPSPVTTARPPASASTPSLTACAIFHRFFADLNKYTPHDQMRLNSDLDGIIPAAASEGNDKLYSDVTDLVAHVGSSSWPDQGTPIDPEITAVQTDCGG